MKKYKTGSRNYLDLKYWLLFRRLHALLCWLTAAHLFIFPILVFYPSLAYPVDYDLIDFDGLDTFSSEYSYSDGSFQVPFSGDALNTALGLEPDTTPAATLQ